MTGIFQKPENALKRAEQLISVNEPGEALNVLHSTISHRRLRVNGWDSCTEQIMMKFVELCVDLSKLKYLRESLHSYRTLTQQHNILSLVKVMKSLRDLSEAKLEAVKARASDEASLAPGVDDLEADETPESLMLSTLQVEVRDKRAKELYAALLGCWETYKIIMDLLRFCPKIDYFYHDTARRALDFCRNNKRCQEFRRLCDTLRIHYLNFQKYRSRPDFESFLRPESHIPTRLAQMDVAAELGLWSQCFHTAEDIISLGLHDFLQRSLSSKETSYYKNRATFLSQASRFYEKLAQIFKVSGQWTFHASAVLRNLFHTRQHKRSVTKEEQLHLCNIAVIAVLCVPILQKSNLSSMELEFHNKLANMIGHGCVTTRAAMHSIIQTRGVLGAASPEIQELYNHIEGKVDPITFCVKAEALIKQVELKETLDEAYKNALIRIVFDRLMLQLGCIYTSILIDFFVDNVCPSSFLPWSCAEPMLVQLVQDNFLHLRLDYSLGVIFFGESSDMSTSSVDNRFAVVADVLEDVVFHPSVASVIPFPLPFDETYHEFYSNFTLKLQEEAKRLHHRNQVLSDRRVQQEKERCEKEEARRTKEKEKQRLEELEEQMRRETALRHHEILRQREAQEQLMLLYAEQIVAEFKAIGEKANGKITLKGKPIEEITPEDILTRKYDYDDYEYVQEELRNKEKQERTRQHRQESKRVEHLARAFREEETRLLQDWKSKMVEKDEKEKQERLLELQEEHKKIKMERDRQRAIFVKVKQHKESYVASLLADRCKSWEAECEKRLERIRHVLKQQKIERARELKRVKEAELREEQERLERERLEAEEKERKEREERRAAEEEEMRKRVFEKQKEKDLEIERRIKQQQEELSRKEPTKPVFQDDLDWSRNVKVTWSGRTATEAPDNMFNSQENINVSAVQPNKYVPPHLRGNMKPSMTSTGTVAPSFEHSVSTKSSQMSSTFHDSTNRYRRSPNNVGQSTGFASRQDVEITRTSSSFHTSHGTTATKEMETTTQQMIRRVGTSAVDDGFTTVKKKVKARSPK